MRSDRLRVWIEGTVFAALAIVLSLIPTNIGTGFTISLGMIPLTLFAFRYGFIAASGAGFLWGILHFLIGTASILHPVQGFIEYFVAFSFVGFAGIVRKPLYLAFKENNKVRQYQYIIIGTTIGTIARFFWHFIAGYYFWGSYAPEGMNPLWYSFIANGGSALATGIATSIVLGIMAKTTSTLFLIKR
ncbi:energy-coupled thiamine transporter ThiT [Carnobacterium pleistocenium]|uniref:energy-coupled thiamine transporter ThiT n=1 Tax=Carnobacterium pleistocenium TaxID=181073 RepID=UPI00054F7695|nr:energy-coupled thiamine transporter ThiT [Carnobacterium pleistocenium]